MNSFTTMRYTAWMFVVSLFASVAGATEPAQVEGFGYYTKQVSSSRASFLQTLPPDTKTYTNYYMRQLENYHRPPLRIQDYIFDKYYFFNPNVSPYLNLTRRNIYGNNYYQRVLPELDRREIANAPRPKPVLGFPAVTSVAVGPNHTAVPVPTSTGVSAAQSYYGKFQSLPKIPTLRTAQDPDFTSAQVAVRPYR